MPAPALPTLFVSHGAPDLALSAEPTRAFLEQLGRELPRPRAIVCFSAHWTTRSPCVESSPAPRTIHDFYGFPAELYALRYAAPGAPELARELAERLARAGLAAELEPRGLDHGAWVPLLLMYPRADVPVVQISLQPALGAAQHFALGRALANCAREGLLVLGSGGATHNLRELGHEPPPDWVRAFDDWLVEAVERGDEAALLDYRRRAPQAERNHPSEEHLFPLFAALAAAGPCARGRAIHRGYAYRALAMTAFRFDAIP